MSKTGMYCTNCKKEFGLDDTVILKDTGFISLAGLGDAIVLPSDGPYIEQLCEDCGKLLQVKEKPAPRLIKAIQMEREIVGHLLADDPNPWIMTEWKEAMDYTNSLLVEQRPNRVVVEIAGQQVLFVSAERPEDLVVIIHDKEKGHSWDQTHTVRRLAVEKDPYPIVDDAAGLPEPK